jgi:hypothetical protein
MKQPNRVKAAMRAGGKAYGYSLSFLSPWALPKKVTPGSPDAQPT